MFAAVAHKQVNIDVNKAGCKILLLFTVEVETVLLLEFVTSYR